MKAATKKIRELGAKRIVLGGASLGGTVALHDGGARVEHRCRIFALGSSRLWKRRRVARRATLPRPRALRRGRGGCETSRGDAKRLYRASQSPRRELLIVPGSEHRTALYGGPGGRGRPRRRRPPSPAGVLGGRRTRTLAGGRRRVTGARSRSYTRSRSSGTPSCSAQWAQQKMRPSASTEWPMIRQWQWARVPEPGWRTRSYRRRVSRLRLAPRTPCHSRFRKLHRSALHTPFSF